MDVHETKKPHPAGKISEAFRKFAWPLVEILGSDVTKQEIEPILEIASIVWNAAVIDSVNGNDDFATCLQEQQASNSLAVAIMMEMFYRKKSEFADDKRAIFDYELFKKDGEWRLRVEAKGPIPTETINGDIPV